MEAVEERRGQRFSVGGALLEILIEILRIYFKVPRISFSVQFKNNNKKID
jgi:hypothetical protein